MNLSMTSAAKASDDVPVTASEEVRALLIEIGEAQRREKDWRTAAENVIKIYECDKAAKVPFNILYSNTETLAPALYNQLPRPVVKRRHNDADPLARAAAQVVERSLAYFLDSPEGESAPLDDTFTSVVHTALLPGRGVSRVKYEAEFAETEAPVEGEPPKEQVTREELCVEEVPWNRFCHGYAKCWDEVPWVSFEHFMTKEELVEAFGPEKAAMIPLTAGKEALKGEDDSGAKSEESSLKLGHVFEVWHKEKREVLFIAKGMPEVAKRVADPLNLTGFFPCPKPLSFFLRVSGLTPQTLYSTYESQAEELNSVTTRIQKIVKALKVRGFYDGTIEGLSTLMEADDNTLLAAENVAALQQGRSLDNSIWLMPLEKLVMVFQQLLQQRQQIKQVIYEITGISDILRGSTQASETATAQNIKNQWGTLRLKGWQKDVGDYIRQTLRMLAEVAVEKLSVDTLKGMTGLQHPTAAEKQQAQMVLQQAQMLQSQGQQVPPEALQQAQATVAQPSWEELLELLRDDLQRGYRIDIETNSTVDVEATEDKEAVGEFLNAVAQLLNGLGPMVQQGTLSHDVVKEMLLATVRRYRFGTEVEEKIMAMPGPQAQGPDPKQLEAQQQELQKQQEALVQEQQAFELAKKEHDLEMKQAQKELDLEKQFALREVEAAKQSAMREVQRTAEVTAQAHEVNIKGREERFNQKQSFAGSQLETQRKELEKQRQAQQLTPEAIAQPILETLVPLLQQIQAAAQPAPPMPQASMAPAAPIGG